MSKATIYNNDQCNNCYQSTVITRDMRQAKKSNFGMQNVPNQFDLCLSCGNFQ